VEGAFAFLLDGAVAGARRAVEDFGVDCEALLCFWGRGLVCVCVGWRVVGDEVGKERGRDEGTRPAT
jgi:hypothetical protein